jgi:uncharacterized membrane protein
MKKIIEIVVLVIAMVLVIASSMVIGFWLAVKAPDTNSPGLWLSILALSIGLAGLLVGYYRQKKRLELAQRVVEVYKRISEIYGRSLESHRRYIRSLLQIRRI